MSEEISLASFETALDDLKRIVEEMESGNLSLEASLSAFERGIQLTRQCQSALSQAQLRVQVLANNTLVPFSASGADATRSASGAAPEGVAEEDGPGEVA